MAGAFWQCPPTKQGKSPDLLNGFSVHVVSDLELRQVRQLALVTQHDLHVAPNRAGPAAAVPPTTQLAPPSALHSSVFSVVCTLKMLADLLPFQESCSWGLGLQD